MLLDDLRKIMLLVNISTPLSAETHHDGRGLSILWSSILALFLDFFVFLEALGPVAGVSWNESVARRSRIGVAWFVAGSSRNRLGSSCDTFAILSNIIEVAEISTCYKCRDETTHHS